MLMEEKIIQIYSPHQSQGPRGRHIEVAQDDYDISWEYIIVVLGTETYI